MTDCLLVGFNDTSFPEYVKMVEAMGTASGAFHDLNLAFVNYEDRPYRSIDLLNRFFVDMNGRAGAEFHNTDFLWPTITYLGTFLDRRGLSFDYVNLFQREKTRFRELLERGDILAVAITTTLYVTPHPIVEIVSFIRRHSRTTKIIVGGPFINNQSKSDNAAPLHLLFKAIGADIYVISQQGEFALTEVIKALKAEQPLADVANIAYMRGKQYVQTAAVRESNPLEQNAVNYGLFTSEALGEFVSLRTAVSCPFSCAFCGFPARAGTYQYNAVDHVEAELNALVSRGTVTTLTFLDDTFNVPKPRFKEILRMMIRNNYGFRWNSFYRGDHGDEETIELMGRAGCEGVFLGVESGSDAQLQRMNKAARRHHYLKAIPLLRAAGVTTYVSLIIGFPGETTETVDETITFLSEARPDFYRAQLWYCDPMTPIWNRRKEFGIRGSAFNWKHDTMTVDEGCRQIERLLMSTGYYTWLPQNGFEPWTLYYLQRKGMDIERVRAFLRCFQDMLRAKIKSPDEGDVPGELITQMKQICDLRLDAESHASSPTVAAI